MSHEACPSQEHLQAMLAEKMPESELLELAGHLKNCRACQQRFERLAERVDLLAPIPVAERRQLASLEPELSRAMKSLHAAPRPATVGAAATVDSPDTPNRRQEIDLSFLAPSDDPSSLGRLGGYEVREAIGKGGMGVVLRGQDNKLNRAVAIKVLAPWLASDATARQRFRREAQAAAAISHEHVVAIHGIDEVGSTPFIVMAFIEGVSLEDRLLRDGPLDLKRVLRIGAQAAAGLAAAHAQGLVHRDIKPGNILLENGVERVKVSDFGLARAANDVRITRTDTVAGTPEYMSPEQASGQALDHRSDLFSLGCVIYAMCAGRSPFRATTMIDAIRRVCDDQPRPIREVNSEVPEFLAEIIDKLLCKDPAERFQSAAEVASLLESHLRHIQAPQEIPKPQPIDLPKKQRSAPREMTRFERRLMYSSLFVAVAGLFLVVWLAVGGGAAIVQNWMYPPTQPQPLETRPPVIAEVDHARSLFSQAKALTDPDERLRKLEQAKLLFEQREANVELVECLYEIGRLHFWRWDFEEGIAAYSKGLEVYESNAASFEANATPPTMARDLAICMGQLGDLEQREQLLKDFIRIHSLTMGESERGTLFAWWQLGHFYADAGRDDEASECLAKTLTPYVQSVEGNALPIWSAIQDENIYTNCRLMMARTGPLDDSTMALVRTFVTKNLARVPDDWFAQRNAALLAELDGKQDLAVDFAQRSATTAWSTKINPGVDNTLRVVLLTDRFYLRYLRDYKRTAQLREALATTIERRDNVFPDNHPQRAYPRQELAALHTAAGEHAKAHELLLRAYEILKAQPLTPATRWAACVEQLAASHEALGRMDEAKQLRQNLDRDRTGQADPAGETSNDEAESFRTRGRPGRAQR